MAWQMDAVSAILSVQSGMYMVFRNYQHPELSIAVHIHSSLQARAGYNVARGATRISHPLCLKRVMSASVTVTVTEALVLRPY